MASLGVCILASCTPGDAAVERSVDGPTSTFEVPAPTGGELRADIVGVGPPEATIGPAGADDGAGNVLLVGDSVLALVADDVARHVRATIHIDAADCRRIDRSVIGPCGGVPPGTEVVSGVAAISGALDRLGVTGISLDAAVVVLANNSTLTRDDVEAAMNELDGVPEVWWVNARIDGFGRQDLNNRLLAQLAAEDDRMAVVDWYAEAMGQEWLADHVHPNETGQFHLGRLIAESLRSGPLPSEPLQSGPPG